MKTKLLFGFLILVVTTFKSYGQFTFGVSPGIGLNSTYFGYKVNNRLVPYIGFQYLNAKFNYEQSGEEYDYDVNQVVSYSDKEEISGSVFIPTLGVKYFIKGQNKLRAYLNLNIAKPIISGKMKTNGEEDEDFRDQIKNVNLWGGEFGFGMEYFFDDNFSLGGEFGLRYIHVKYKDSYDSDFYNPDLGDYQATTIDTDLNLSSNPTYSKISLNFYF